MAAVALSDWLIGWWHHVSLRC